jgi:hypothetical protein
MQFCTQGEKWTMYIDAGMLYIDVQLLETLFKEVLSFGNLSEQIIFKLPKFCEIKYFQNALLRFSVLQILEGFIYIAWLIHEGLGFVQDSLS